MKKRQTKKWIFLILILLFIFLIVFLINRAKIGKMGNTKSSQEIVNTILNVSSYEMIANVEVQSNKNKNSYIIKQTYKGPNDNKQEILEPSNIAGLIIKKENDKLTLENTHLSLVSIYEKYTAITDNCLDLSSFIEDYKQDDKPKINEKENEIILETRNKDNTSYYKQKKLFIDKKTRLPTKLEIKDDNQNLKVYILYNEVKINSIK